MRPVFSLLVLTARRADARAWLACAGIAMLVAFAVFAVIGRFTMDWARIDMNVLAASPPTRPHILGTDEIGRDALARLAGGVWAFFVDGLFGVLVWVVPCAVFGTTAALLRVRHTRFSGVLFDIAVISVCATWAVLVVERVVIAGHASAADRFRMQLVLATPSIWLTLFIGPMLALALSREPRRDGSLRLPRRAVVMTLVGASAVAVTFNSAIAELQYLGGWNNTPPSPTLLGELANRRGSMPSSAWAWAPTAAVLVGLVSAVSLICLSRISTRRPIVLVVILVAGAEMAYMQAPTAMQLVVGWHDGPVSWIAITWSSMMLLVGAAAIAVVDRRHGRPPAWEIWVAASMASSVLIAGGFADGI